MENSIFSFFCYITIFRKISRESGECIKVIRAVEENGGVVVTYENCNGAKKMDELVDESNPDVYDAIARRYLNVDCSVMSPNPNRKVLLKKLCEEYQVDGVLEMVLQIY